MIYSTFATLRDADQAYMDLLQLGANLQDLIVISRESFADPVLQIDDGTLGMAPRRPEFLYTHRTICDAPDVFGDGSPPLRRSPFGDNPGDKGIASGLNYAGDLYERVLELGFSGETAQRLEGAILDGGAILIARVPSGPINDIQAWFLIERSSGVSLAQLPVGPYVI